MTSSHPAEGAIVVDTRGTVQCACGALAQSLTYEWSDTPYQDAHVFSVRRSCSMLVQSCGHRFVACGFDWAKSKWTWRLDRTTSRAIG